MGIGLSPVFSLWRIAQKCGAVRGMQALPGPWWRRERLLSSAGMAWGGTLLYAQRRGGRLWRSACDVLHPLTSLVSSCCCFQA